MNEDQIRALEEKKATQNTISGVCAAAAVSRLVRGFLADGGATYRREREVAVAGREAAVPIPAPTSDFQGDKYGVWETGRKTPKEMMEYYGMI